MTYHPDCVAHCTEPEICLGSTDGPETWKPINGFPGYLVSDHGRVLSGDRPDTCGRWRTGRILRQLTDEHGYRRVTLYRGGESYNRKVHSLVLEAFIGPRPAGLETRHLDGDPANNRITNLRWGTRSENVADVLRHGTHHNAVKETCNRGHVLAAPNLRPSALRRGWRICLACDRARAYLRRYPDPDLDIQTLADRHYRKIMDLDVEGAA